MRPMVNRISISNVQLYICAVKVINTHMRDVEGNRFFTTTRYCQLDRQMNEQAERSVRERKVKDWSHRAWACVDLTWGHHSSPIIQNDNMYVCIGTLAPPPPSSFSCLIELVPSTCIRDETAIIVGMMKIRNQII